MLTVKMYGGAVMKLAESEKELVQSLFDPTGSASGVIEKVNKRCVWFSVGQVKYVLNRWGVICKQCSLSDGRPFYQYQLEFATGAGHDLAEQLGASGETLYKGYFFKS